MITIDRFQELADEAAADIPQEFFDHLNGGIVILPQRKLHPESRPESPLCVMGEYTHSHMMGRNILLYYGSIMSGYGHLDDESLKNEIRRIILHEFTHHLESLAGTNQLEVDDAVRLRRYLSQFE